MRHLRAHTLTNKSAVDWSLHLPLVQRIMNATPNRSTGVAPATLLYGNAIDLNRGLITLCLPDNRNNQSPST